MTVRAWLSTLFELRQLYNRPLLSLPCAAFCLVCGQNCVADWLCSACIGDLPRRSERRLRRRIRGVSAAFAAYHYAFPLDRLIKSAKFGGDLCALDTLAARLAAEPDPTLYEVDCLIAVPLAPARYVMRGFNQAIELARPLATALGKPLLANHARRVRTVRPQSRLPAADRTANVRDAFRIQGDVRGKTLLIVDDVITTGATLAALAGALRRAGAADVRAVSVAATARQ